MAAACELAEGIYFLVKLIFHRVRKCYSITFTVFLINGHIVQSFRLYILEWETYFSSLKYVAPSSPVGL